MQTEDNIYNTPKNMDRWEHKSKKRKWEILSDVYKGVDVCSNCRLDNLKRRHFADFLGREEMGVVCNFCYRAKKSKGSWPKQRNWKSELRNRYPECSLNFDGKIEACEKCGQDSRDIVESAQITRNLENFTRLKKFCRTCWMIKNTENAFSPKSNHSVPNHTHLSPTTMLAPEKSPPNSSCIDSDVNWSSTEFEILFAGISKYKGIHEITRDISTKSFVECELMTSNLKLQAQRLPAYNYLGPMAEEVEEMEAKVEIEKAEEKCLQEQSDARKAYKYSSTEDISDNVLLGESSRSKKGARSHDALLKSSSLQTLSECVYMNDSGAVILPETLESLELALIESFILPVMKELAKLAIINGEKVFHIKDRHISAVLSEISPSITGKCFDMDAQLDRIMGLLKDSSKYQDADELRFKKTKVLQNLEKLAKPQDNQDKD